MIWVIDNLHVVVFWAMAVLLAMDAVRVRLGRDPWF